MSLYVRVSCGYWTHRKTLRLSAILGPAWAYIPVRLWCYCAENQPDGDFEKYLPEELALLVGYSGDAQAMLQALQQAGFMDGMKVHDWQEHNSYHQTFSDRAKKAAAARWNKTRKERKGKETSNASSISTEKKDVFPTTPRSLKIADLFNRRPTTPWEEKEIKSFRTLSKHPEEDLDLVIEFYRHSESPYLRKELYTFLNNFSGELDRARAWKTIPKINGTKKILTAAEQKAIQAAQDAAQEHAHQSRI